MSQNRAVHVDTLSLYAAIEKKDVNQVKEYLSVENHNIDLNHRVLAEYGAHSLLRSIENGCPDIALCVLKAGADPSVQRTPDLNTALHIAGTSGHIEVVRELLTGVEKWCTQGVDQHEWNMLTATNQVSPCFKKHIYYLK